MKRMKTIVATAVLLICMAGCDRDMMSEKGFRLPDGDAIAGREAFLYMQCHQCHTIRGEELPALPFGDPPYVELGGKVTRVRTYGELVTSIINPSHKLASGYAEELVSENGESNMYNYNGYMTVQELTDLVVFLQPHYEVMTPAYPIRIHP
ncbi:MAG: cytochrome C [Woeseia sp.]|jgi:L-cysteine S-thiosulfotransferase|nr:cytochrome C [Woeseia sp.]MBT6209605.1 cytochrome C [Woeseia sp.]